MVSTEIARQLNWLRYEIDGVPLKDWPLVDMAEKLIELHKASLATHSERK